MLGKIALSKFRNFSEKTFSFSEGITIIVGPNGIGKTNILEGIFFLSTGRSFRATVEKEVISYDEEIARIKGRIKNVERIIDLEAILTRGEIMMGTDAIEKAPKKKLLVNGVSKRLIDFSGNLRSVLFGPWDLDLVTESPSIRRKFLDTVLAQVDREYRRAILSYEKGLRQRNKLLFRIREEGASRSQLLFWNQLLIKSGDYISRSRENFLEFVNQTKSLDGGFYKIDYDKSSISEGRLEQYRNEEVASATTLVGPHRDDFIVNSEKRDLGRFGSRGQQRMAVLWLKLAELSFIEKETSVRPLLLLDDIFSELDHEHREIVIEVAKNQQTIISTAEPHYIEGFGKVEIIELE